jgi:hypothetical protein
MTAFRPPARERGRWVALVKPERAKNMLTGASGDRDALTLNTKRLIIGEIDVLGLIGALEERVARLEAAEANRPVEARQDLIAAIATLSERLSALERRS